MTNCITLTKETIRHDEYAGDNRIADREKLTNKYVATYRRETKMKELEIEWKHLDVDGKTCDRCAGTGDEIHQLVDHLRKECAPQDVHITLKEIKLTEREIEESNHIFINGIPLEEIIPETTVSKNTCSSCSNLIGHETCCRTIIHSGREYETVPQKLIKEAVCKIAKCC